MNRNKKEKMYIVSTSFKFYKIFFLSYFKNKNLLKKEFYVLKMHLICTYNGYVNTSLYCNHFILYNTINI